MSNLFKKEVVLIILVYSLSHFLLLFNSGIFWDDWNIYRSDRLLLLDIFKESGAILSGYIHVFLLSFKQSIFLYRAITFFLYLFSALIVFNILKRVKEMDSYSRLFVSMFFAIFPVNSARIAMINLPAGLRYFIFFMGFLLTVQVLEKRSFAKRAVALVLFLLSFTYNSFITFYVLVLIYIFYKIRSEVNAEQPVLRYALRYLDFYVLPVVFWIARNLFFTPQGYFREYYSITLNGILHAVKWSSVGLYTSFVEPLLIIFKSFSFFVVISAIILASFISKNERLSAIKNGHHQIFFVFGILFFLVAVFPYFVIYGLPQTFDWQSRYQILVPMGASLILYYGFRILFDKLEIKIHMQTAIFSAIICLCISANISNYLEYQRDWYKQLSLIDKFKGSTYMKDNTTFLFIDNTQSMNAKNRVYRFYEYAGLMKHSFGDETRFGENFSAFNGFASYRNACLWYNLREYKENEMKYKVIIDYGDYILNNDNLIRLMLRDLFTPIQFSNNIKRLIRLKCENCP